MRLKSLEVFGFKSFADRMKFDFEGGITGVVGPNGCGKSNVVDALRWVMGEQSAKSLRGGEMNDVIFGGTARRKPMGYCEVVVTFDNSSRKLPVDHDEVAIGRRLYRTGEGEYFINKELCRLRDIREMIMDTGVGTASYCFIAQGQIDRLLTSDPKERRMVFEEAAGISKYRQRKAAALRKLDRVEQNLQVLSSVRDEVDKRFKSVARQAQKARRYRRLQDELKEKQVILAMADYRDLIDSRDSLDTDLSALREKEAVAQARVSCEEARVSQAELEEVGLERCASEADTRRIQSQAEAERLEAEIKHAEERATELDSTIQSTREEIEKQEIQLRARTEDRERLQSEVQNFTSEAERNKQSFEGVKKASQDSVQRERELSEKVQKCQTEALEAVRARAESQNALSALESDARNTKARVERLESDLETIGREFEEAHVKADEAAGRCTHVSDQLEEAVKASAEAQEKISSLQRQLSGLDEMLVQKRTEIESRRARLAYLKELEDKREGVSSGSREVMKAVREENVKFGEVLGLVAELVKSQPDVETAIETALGGRASDLIVDSPKTASVAIDFLKVGRLGRASFLPLDRMRKTLVLPEELNKHDGVIGRACDLLEFDSKLQPAIEYLLGRVLIVRDREAALRLAKDAGPGTRMVTLDGEIVDGNGPITGGMSQSGNPGLLTRKTEIDKLQRIIAEAEGMLIALSKNQSHVAESREQTCARAEELAAKERELDGLLAEVKAELTSLRKEEKSLEARRFTMAAEYDESRRDRDLLVERVASLSEKVKSLEEAEAVSRKEADSYTGQIAGAREERETSEKELADLRVAMAGLEEKREAATSALETVCREISEREKTVQNRREEVDRMVVRARESRESAETKRHDLIERGSTLEQYAAEALQARTKRDELRGELESMRKSNRESRAELLEAQTTLNELRVKENEFVVRIESIEERARNDFGVSLAERLEAERNSPEPVVEELSELEAEGEAAPEATPVEPQAEEAPAVEQVAEASVEENDEDDEGDGASADAMNPADIPTEVLREQIEELRRKLNAMGSVNMFALEEQKELEERSKFLNAQHNDLTKAQASLKEVIGKINRKSRDLFQETFDAVRERFKDLFRRLFGGGRADVFLEEGVDILEAGIEVIAQPPGREALKLSLLSGGQKAMTTIALLFAIFGAKPSPFCVLDEVDAPLDDANVDRFNMILRDYTNTTQFIVITHNKATMGYAGALYGVTMQEPGVSRKISIRLEDVDDNMEIKPQALEDIDQEGPFAKRDRAA